MNIRNELNQVFKNVFDHPSIEIYDAMTANDLEGWDSLAHITLMIAIEDHFKVELTTPEVSDLKNVGEMIQLLSRKIH